MNRAHMPVALPLLALVLLVVFLLQGCVIAPPSDPDAPQPDQDKPRTMKADYSEPACQALASFGLIAAVGVPIYMVVSGFANRACSGVAK